VRAAVVEKPGVVRVREVPDPKVENEYELLVKVKRAAICRHPDYELWKGLRPPVKDGWAEADYPFILGHEFCGEVVEMGSKVKEVFPDVKVGDRICEWTWCEGFAEYVKIDVRRIATIAPLPDNVSDEEGAVLELAGGSTIFFAWSIVRPLDRVLILGCGPAGICFIQHAKNFGAEAVVATEIYKNRIELAKKVGADAVYDASSYDPEELGRLIAREWGPIDVVIDTAGASEAVFTGVEALKPGGSFYIFAHVSEALKVPYFKVATKVSHFGPPRIFPDRERMKKLMRLAVRWVSEGKLNLKDMITHHFPLEKIEDALRFNWEHPEECVKVAIDVA